MTISTYSDYNINDFLTKHRDDLIDVMEKVTSNYPDDMVYEVHTSDSVSPTLTVYACKHGVRIEICKQLCLMEGDLMADMISAAIEAAMHDEPLELPEAVRSWIYNEMWKCDPRDDLPVVEYSKMPPQLLHALVLLRKSGLLDDLPEGIRLTGRGSYESVAMRIAYIPNKLEMYGCDESSSIEKLVTEVYSRCFLKHIVKHAMMDGLNAPENRIREEMEEYAHGVVNYELTAEE